MADLSQRRVAVIAMNGVEESEIKEPIEALRSAGAEVDVLSPEGGEIQLMHRDEKTEMLPADGRVSERRPRDYDAVVLPGGVYNADKLRMVEEVREFVRAMDAAGKTMAVICHAPWVLVSSGLVKGRTLTSYYTLQDDIRNAGGHWVDEEVSIDGNLITSRSPRDLPAFNRSLSDALAAVRAGARSDG